MFTAGSGYLCFVIMCVVRAFCTCLICGCVMMKNWQLHSLVLSGTLILSPKGVISDLVSDTCHLTPGVDCHRADYPDLARIGNLLIRKPVAI